MIELIKYFRILFLSPRISRERLKDFCESHIARLAANNPGGIFTVILTDVTTCYNNYYGDMRSEVTNLAVQEGKTIAMNEAKENLLVLIRKDEKLIAYKYAESKDIYEEFFPQGLTEYDRVDLPTLLTIGDRLKDAFAAHSADFDAAVITEYNDTYETFVDNRKAQTQAMSNVDSERSDLATTKPALCKQLTVNLLTIALKYVGDDTKSNVYFDQSILNAAFKEGETKVSNEINDGVTENAFENITKREVELKITVSGGGPLYVGFAADATTPITADTGKTFSSGDPVTFNAGQLGFTKDEKIFLNVTNSSGTILSYTIEKV